MRFAVGLVTGASFCLGAVTASMVASVPAARVEILRPAGGIPAHIAGLFRNPVNFQQAHSGQYFVFDRRGHTVYGINAELTAASKIVSVGPEEGRLLEPTAFDLGPDGTFVVADAPRNQERIQLFSSDGKKITGFTLPGRPAPRVTLGQHVLNGIGSLQYSGRSILLSLPETGALVTEYTLQGIAVRTFGELRKTGYESDSDVHLALNSGIPIRQPDGQIFFVFQAGVPLLRKYSATGTMLYERHIEGPELDAALQALPTTWPSRRIDRERILPLIPPTVRTAAVDSAGRLWISLTVPYTYVYDGSGEKVRTVQFRAADTIAPSSLFFSPSGKLLVTPGCYEFATR